MTVVIKKGMSSEEMNKVIQEICDKKEKEQQTKKSEAIKNAAGILKHLDKPVDEIMKEL